MRKSRYLWNLLLDLLFAGIDRGLARQDIVESGRQRRIDLFQLVVDLFGFFHIPVGKIGLAKIKQPKSITFIEIECLLEYGDRICKIFEPSETKAKLVDRDYPFWVQTGGDF